MSEQQITKQIERERERGGGEQGREAMHKLIE